MSEEVQTKEHDVVMIGAGPSALAAAVYTTRENIDTVETDPSDVFQSRGGIHAGLPEGAIDDS